MTVAAPQAYEASWLPEAEAMNESSVASDGVDAAEGEIGLAADRLHLLRLRREVERQHLVARRIVRSAIVDRVGDAGVLQGHRGVGHHRGALGDEGEDRFAGGVEVIDDVDVESVLFERNDGRRERLVVGQRSEAASCLGRAHSRVLLVHVIPRG